MKKLLKSDPTPLEITFARALGEAVTGHLNVDTTPDLWEAFIAASQILKRDTDRISQTFALVKEALDEAGDYNSPESKRATQNALDVIEEIDRRGDLNIANGADIAKEALYVLYVAGFTKIRRDSRLARSLRTSFRKCIDIIAEHKNPSQALQAIEGLDYEEGKFPRGEPDVTRNITYGVWQRKFRELAMLAA